MKPVSLHPWLNPVLVLSHPNPLPALNKLGKWEEAYLDLGKKDRSTLSIYLPIYSSTYLSTYNRPSQYAVFESVAPAGKDYIVWEDMWTAKRMLDQMKETGDGPFPITDEYLQKSFVYQLMRRYKDR